MAVTPIFRSSTGLYLQEHQDPYLCFFTLDTPSETLRFSVHPQQAADPVWQGSAALPQDTLPAAADRQHLQITAVPKAAVLPPYAWYHLHEMTILNILGIVKKLSMIK